MKDWQKRVVDEEKELGQKIDRLFYFVENGMASPEDMRVLRLQGAVMTLYRQILRERIDAFND